MSAETARPDEAGDESDRPTGERSTAEQIPPVDDEPPTAENDDLAARLTVDPVRDDVKG